VVVKLQGEQAEDIVKREGEANRMALKIGERLKAYMAQKKKEKAYNAAANKTITAKAKAEYFKEKEAQMKRYAQERAKAQADARIAKLRPKAAPMQTTIYKTVGKKGKKTTRTVTAPVKQQPVRPMQYLRDVDTMLVGEKKKPTQSNKNRSSFNLID